MEVFLRGSSSRCNDEPVRGGGDGIGSLSTGNCHHNTGPVGVFLCLCVCVCVRDDSVC